jgi:hypothetical protein
MKIYVCLYVQYTIHINAIMQYIIKMLRLACRLIYRVPSPDNDLYVRRTGFCEQRRDIESSLNLLKRLPIYRLCYWTPNSRRENPIGGVTSSTGTVAHTLLEQNHEGKIQLEEGMRHLIG